MNYCSLEDAYQVIGSAPTPGCTADYATKQARKEERKKARRCKGPAATYFDADRPMIQTSKEVPPMNTEAFQGEEDFKHKKEHVDQDVPNFDKDPMYDYLQKEISDHVIRVNPSSTEAMGKNFFGADPDDSFADYAPAEVETPTDFRAAFEQSGIARAGSVASMPSANMYWKPKTPSGAQTAFVEHLPPMPQHSNRVRSDPAMADVMRKMDKLFAKLEDMNAGASPEQVTSEMMMFVSSGIFVLFLMDLLVKKGSTLKF